MIIKPRVRGFICLTAHPEGCEKNVTNQIDFTKSKGEIADGPKNVLVIGASTGFGLASRIVSAFGSDSSTIGVFFEKPPMEGKPATPGWYNTVAFEKEAHAKGLYAKSINGDAFSNEIKQKTIDLIKSDLKKIDLVIYSLASPRKVHPDTQQVYNSVIKPIGKTFENKTVDFHSGTVSNVVIEPCTEEEVNNTVEVMGGDDWERWIDVLKKEDVLSPECLTVAYSYVGPEVTTPIYRNGSIGRAKDHLEQSAFKISEKLKDIDGKAYVSVNKALVTQASSAIPVIPLYISLLYKAMKEEGVHEGCIEQIYRLFETKLFSGEIPTDEKGRIRIDDWEMRPDIQEKVSQLWDKVTTENIGEIADLEGYRNDFFKLFGFGYDSIDYDVEVNELQEIPGLVE